MADRPESQDGGYSLLARVGKNARHLHEGSGGPNAQAGQAPRHRLRQRKAAEALRPERAAGRNCAEKAPLRAVGAHRGQEIGQHGSAARPEVRSRSHRRKQNDDKGSAQVRMQRAGRHEREELFCKTKPRQLRPGGAVGH